MIPPKKITVLIADDHAIVRQGFCALLETDDDFAVVGEARTGQEAVAMAGRLQPDVVLMDIGMPVLNGLEATRQILAAGSQARVLVLSAHSEDEYVERAVAAGVIGFLEKQTSAEILTQAIHAAAKGQAFFSPAIAKRLAESRSRSTNRDGLAQTHGSRLTAREAEVLQLVAEGQANKQVASSLRISIKTVEKHRQHVMDKLNIHETAGLTRYAIAHGIVEASVQVTIL
jgi:DNA-binding NarL/FixJ family response regulator